MASSPSLWHIQRLSADSIKPYICHLNDNLQIINKIIKKFVKKINKK